MYFFDGHESILEGQHYNKKPLTPDVVMEIVNKYWKMQGEDGKYIPRFEHVYEKMDADIRVKFKSE